MQWHAFTTSKNSHPCKKWFITFPQSTGVTKQTFVESIVEAYPVEAYICAEEPHKDTGVHLHLAIHFKTPITKSNLLLYFKRIYPNGYKRIDVRSMKSWSSSVRYLTFPEKDKETDPHPLIWGFTPSDEIFEEWSEAERFQNYMEKLRDYHVCMGEKIADSFDSRNINCYLETLPSNLNPNFQNLVL